MRVDAVSFVNIPEIQKTTQTNNNNNVDFGEYLKKAIDKVNDKQIDAEQSTQQLITGEATDIHQVMIATEEARLSLELAVQMRNKMVDAYQELSRMQI
jgi:flagellar hook-basal body complex protein FliE